MESETQLHTERQIPATRSLDPTKGLMIWIHMGLDKLMLDSTVWSNRLVAKEQHTALSLSLMGWLHTGVHSGPMLLLVAVMEPVCFFT